MENINTGVETKPTDAPKSEAQGVETTGSQAPVNPEVIDYKAELDKLQVKYGVDTALLAEERDNYKEGLLVAKGKKAVAPEDETEEDRLRRITREELARTSMRQFDTEKEALLQKVLKQNAELATALKNRSGISNNTAGGTGSGANTNMNESNPSFFSAEQLAALKARGWDDKKIETLKQNIQKNKGQVPALGLTERKSR